MTTKKQAREYEKRRREQLRLKLEQRTIARRRRQRVTGFALLGIGVTITIAVGVWLALTNDDAPAAPVTAAPGAAGWGASTVPPDPSLAEDREWTVQADSNQGELTFSLDGHLAPQATASFVSLANDGFFDDTECHRVTTKGIFVLQCGDPEGTGTGGPQYRFGPIENAPEDDFYPAGTIAMARPSGAGDRMGSQFFIVYEDSTIPSDSVGGYTVFGHVTSGLDIVEGVAAAGTITGDSDGRPAKSFIFTEVTAS